MSKQTNENITNEEIARAKALLVDLENQDFDVKTLNERDWVILRKYHNQRALDPKTVAYQIHSLEIQELEDIRLEGGAFSIDSYKSQLIANQMILFGMDEEISQKYLAHMAILVSEKGAGSLVYQKHKALRPAYWVMMFPVARGYSTGKSFSFFRLKICFGSEIIRWRSVNLTKVSSMGIPGLPLYYGIYMGQEYTYLIPDEIAKSTQFLDALARKIEEVRQLKLTRTSFNEFNDVNNINVEIDAIRLVAQMLLTRQTINEDTYRKTWGYTIEELKLEILQNIKTKGLQPEGNVPL